jgi:predicted RNA-binding protein YlxR (DUF448 family)
MGKKPSKEKPCRVCIGCGEEKPKNELIRIVRMSDGTIHVDAPGRKNGRGAYICRNPECLRKAIKTKGLDRSFKEAVPADVYEQLSEEMKELYEG